MNWLTLVMGSKRGAIAAIVCGALVIALLAAGIGLGVYDVKLQTMTAQRDAGVTANKALQQRIDSANTRVDELNSANVGWEFTYATLKGIYDAEVRDRLARQEADEAALAAAQAARARAEDTAAAWMKRYAEQIREPDCERALATLEASCPALQGY
jgi:hypothetical protein